ncbi:MAG: hypothetical protein ABSF15_01885 [Candidatus Sulfotelmatobacter sp.]|jgi:hypothetical protein
MNLRSAPIILCLLIRLLAQSSPSPAMPTVLYTESFRPGPTRVVEEHFDAKLTSKNPVYRQRVKDSNGNDRYAFSITPHGPEGDNEITYWQVKLADLRHSIYENLLLTSQDQASDYKDADDKDALWRLDPASFEHVPLTAKRIIKVESFYVVLQVKAHHFTPLDSPYLDSVTVAIEFTNTDPRNQEGARP